jgi:protein-S-isoprenylcysteine O-methyltransferase Ste14
MADPKLQQEARAEIAGTEEAAERSRATRRAGLFDLRRIIGGLLGLYGVILTVMGLFASSATKSKAVGINIDLWTGVGLLAAAAAFLVWLALRPLRAEDLTPSEAADDDRADAA